MGVEETRYMVRFIGELSEQGFEGADMVLAVNILEEVMQDNPEEVTHYPVSYWADLVKKDLHGEG